MFFADKIQNMTKIWKVKPEVPEDVAHTVINFLSPPPNLPPQGGGSDRLLAQLLFNRGLTDKDQIADFLDVKYENLHSPFLFKDMQKAVERIWQAIENHEPICIYGDYDADAVTANAVLRQTFVYLGADVTSYIPDRFTEGYGVNLDALLKIKDAGSRIIITVDCGTNSVDAAEFCAKNNIDFIITDHHEIIGQAPKAFALINPKNSDDNYPYSEITGVGVAFKLACAILKNPQSAIRNQKIVPGFEKWLLDLVAIGTVADCHSLMGENRILVKYGLKVLAKTKWVGLRALMSSAGLTEDGPLGPPQRAVLLRPLDTYTLGFVIAPRLNAAGRLEHANVALDLLLENNPDEAAQKAAVLEQINRRRQELTERVLSEAREQALLLSERKILALMGQGWPKGVVGLVAGRLADEFNKPTIVLEQSEVLSTGSARTVGEFNILEAIKFGSKHLVKFGGHKQAAGLSLKAENFTDFYQQLLLFADANMPAEPTSRILELEAELTPCDLSLVTCHLLELLEPFGVDNHKPKFLVKNANIVSARTVGQTGKHLQLRLKIGAKEIAAIYFNAPDIAKNLKIGDTVDIACELIRDGWNGREEVKLRIIDIHQNL